MEIANYVNQHEAKIIHRFIFKSKSKYFKSYLRRHLEKKFSLDLVNNYFAQFFALRPIKVSKEKKSFTSSNGSKAKYGKDYSVSPLKSEIKVDKESRELYYKKLNVSFTKESEIREEAKEELSKVNIEEDKNKFYTFLERNTDLIEVSDKKDSFLKNMGFVVLAGLMVLGIIILGANFIQ